MNKQRTIITFPLKYKTKNIFLKIYQKHEQEQRDIIWYLIEHFAGFFLYEKPHTFERSTGKLLHVRKAN